MTNRNRTMNMRYKVKYQQMSTNVIKSVNVFTQHSCQKITVDDSWDWMCVPEVCSHEIVCVEDSVVPVAAADVGGCQ